MNPLDFVTTTEVQCATSSLDGRLKPDFTREQFGRDGRVHAESRCNRCGFRITATESGRFDNEEQAHASVCRRSEDE
jgi:hypothetical protein